MLVRVSGVYHLGLPPRRAVYGILMIGSRHGEIGTLLEPLHCKNLGPRRDQVSKRMGLGKRHGRDLSMILWCVHLLAFTSIYAMTENLEGQSRVG